MAAGLVAEPRRRARARAPASPLFQPASRAGQAESGHGPRPCQAAALLLALGPRRPVAAVGQLISSGLAQQCLNEWFSIYSLLFENRNGLKNVWVLKFAPNLLKQILLGSLSSDLLGKNCACHFEILFYRILFNLEYC